jgi:hypothetical protein
MKDRNFSPLSTGGKDSLQKNKDGIILQFKVPYTICINCYSLGERNSALPQETSVGSTKNSTGAINCLPKYRLPLFLNTRLNFQSPIHNGTVWLFLHEILCDLCLSWT